MSDRNTNQRLSKSLSRLYRKKKPGVFARKLHHYGFGADRFMWWWWQDIVNFGDWIGPELFAFRTGRLPIYAPVYKRPSNSAVHVTVGSIMTGLMVSDVATVWGSGILDIQKNFAKPREIRAVRGPLTRQRCLDQGYPCPDIYGDPGLLVSDIYSERDAAASVDVGIVPHFQDIEAATKSFGTRDDVRIIDVRRPLGEVVSDILGSRLVLSSSMHGLIVAHAFGRRALHIEFGRKIPGDGTKFHDYYRGIGFDGAPAPIRIGADTSLADLKRLAEAAACPDVEPFRSPLRDSCPF
ncbi:polysaccharide pyruvyl transferase family protein [uncultured Paracoccus sp.]|jgi:hypothetical protein|uniref:polysaccharide pyruvyl transferase family protein n=1 Tax=uncultured Paracoccus sp. TaxID=189685 RepID=UPI00263259C5|nr:polysaccharide pyruvyl transferase family protein [uncultured Paracoccus sp.]MCS5601572.1 polysaccharide pyruvyl transferase family protein [Paracoccus sp. (in: a-proteobacteria)]|tara:strand:+ start:1969 stop:2853 length:885 start_codon:yes stop_codon:yes gene_type:complete